MKNIFARFMHKKLLIHNFLYLNLDIFTHNVTKIFIYLHDSSNIEMIVYTDYV